MSSFARVLGRLLRHVHAGERHLAWFSPALAAAPDTITITSPAFTGGAPMPQRFTAPPSGSNTSPPFAIHTVPAGTAELVLIAQDPDAPFPRPVLHALLTGIPPDCTTLPEGMIATAAAPFHRGQVHGGKQGYTGPKPPPGHGPHRYIFQVIASDVRLDISSPPTLAAVLRALDGHVLARGQIVGTHENP